MTIVTLILATFAFSYTLARWRHHGECELAFRAGARWQRLADRRRVRRVAGCVRRVKLGVSEAEWN